MRKVVGVLLVLLCCSAAATGGDMEVHENQVFAYVYFMSGNPEEIREAVPGHIRYWEDLRLEGYRGGPFADRSGGMIVFTAGDEDQAKRIVARDPFVERGVVGESWLKAWRVE